MTTTHGPSRVTTSYARTGCRVQRSFSPLDVPDDPPPIDVTHIEVLRVTNPRLAGEVWPEYDCIEDCWAGRPSDARSLSEPSQRSDSPTWTGETLFGRVMPKAPKGKAWCNGEPIRVRKGSKRSPDIHPLVWWLMSEKARTLSEAEWQVKHRQILSAQNRRSIPRVELDKMPDSTALAAHLGGKLPTPIHFRSKYTQHG